MIILRCDKPHMFLVAAAKGPFELFKQTKEGPCLYHLEMGARIFLQVKLTFGNPCGGQMAKVTPGT
jgi:hypothetical protein